MGIDNVAVQAATRCKGSTWVSDSLVENEAYQKSTSPPLLPKHVADASRYLDIAGSSLACCGQLTAVRADCGGAD
jgi:hypothetical protein